mmetsp:Transcript_64394/g.151279  ORF Transcript_64394/g.151279 Transcript_64394/m.151279 type:complete len:89 (+) Transcript_64394:1251-1517(+)
MPVPPPGATTATVIFDDSSGFTSIRGLLLGEIATCICPSVRALRRDRCTTSGPAGVLGDIGGEPQFKSEAFGVWPTVRMKGVLIGLGP